MLILGWENTVIPAQAGIQGYTTVNYETPRPQDISSTPKSPSPLGFLISRSTEDAINQAMTCASSAHA